MDEQAMQKLIDARIQIYLKTKAFSNRTLADTPTDAFAVVPRKFVTNNGTSTNRPTASIIGQPYLDMTLGSGRGKPIWWNGTGFIDSTGTYV